MTAEVLASVSGTAVISNAATVTAEITNTPVAGDVVIAILAANSAQGRTHSIAGLGAIWTQLGTASENGNVFTYWKGIGATASGTVTATQLTGTSEAASNKVLSLWHVRGTSALVEPVVTIAIATGTVVGSPAHAGPGQVVLAAGYSNTSTNAIFDVVPSTGWTTRTVDVYGAQRYIGLGHRVPTAAATHRISDSRSDSATHPIIEIVVGTGTEPAADAPSDVPVVRGIYDGTNTTLANPTTVVTATPAAGDLLIVFATCGTANGPHPTAVSGCGATWTPIPRGGMENYVRAWVGHGATTSGSVTGTVSALTTGRTLRVFHISGVEDPNAVFLQSYGTGGPAVLATPNQLVIGACYSQSSTLPPIASTVPATGWTAQTEITHSASRRFNTTYINPTATSATFNVVPNAYAFIVWVGSPIPGTTVARQNRVANAGFETVNTYWSASAGNIAVSTAQTRYGRSSVSLTASGANGQINRLNGGGGNGPSGPVVPGRTYTLSCWVYAVPDGRQMAIYPQWSAINDSVTSMPVGTPSYVAVPANTWTQLTWTGVAPNVDPHPWGVLPRVRMLDSVSGDVFYTDGVLVEEGSTVGAFFDGSSVDDGYFNIYNGPTDLSMSIQVTEPAGLSRINMLFNPSYELNNSSWTTMTRENTTTQSIISGAWYASISSGASRESHARPATAGLDYTGSAWFTRPTSTARSVSVSVHFYDAAGAELSAPTITNTALATELVPERRWSTRTAPAGTVSVKMSLNNNSGVVHADAFLLEQSSTLGDYFDGDTAAAGLVSYGWIGAPHASPSYQLTESTETTTVTFNRRESGAWVEYTAVPKVRVSGAWETIRPQHWDGVAWVDLE